MASFFLSKDQKDEQDRSRAEMLMGDVEAIGEHCQAPYCNQLDFLPFTCKSCKKKFCLDHAKESAHSCRHADDRAVPQQQAFETNAKFSNKPSILTHESQCSAPICKTLINTPLVPGVECPGCNRSYCLKHRMKEDHDCKNLPVIGARTQNISRMADAFSRLKSWNASKKAATSFSPSNTKSPVKSTNASTSVVVSTEFSSSLHRIISPFTSARSSRSSKTSQIVEVNKMKRTAKGDSKIPSDKRVYLHVEAVASGEGASGARIPRCDAFFSLDWSVGKMLDSAAKLLSITNVNNHGGGEEQKLRVFHIEKGQLLRFSDKVQAVNLKDCDTIVLLRGVGDPEAK